MPYNQPAPYDGWFQADVDAPEPVVLDGRAYIPIWGYRDEISVAAQDAIAQIRFLDHYLGEILTALELLCLRDQTQVIGPGPSVAVGAAPVE